MIKINNNTYYFTLNNTSKIENKILQVNRINFEVLKNQNFFFNTEFVKNIEI